MRPTTAYVDLDALKRNLQAIRKQVGARQIMGVVKANAYGHGLVRVARELLRDGCDQLGVAFLQEGIVLRQAGIKAPILVLGGIIGNQIQRFIDHDLMITAASAFKVGQIEEVAKHLGRRAKIHLKIDTGMERLGTHWDTAPKLFDAAVGAKHCDLVGVFSHFACSDSLDFEFTKLQQEKFEECLHYFEAHSLPMPTRHMANSGAILQHPGSYFDMVRPGIMLYGVYPSDEVRRSIELSPVLSLETRVVYFKVVKQGSCVSYNCTWTAKEDTRVVTLPVGYGDGYSRMMSGKAQVLIHGERFDVIGRITMDALVVDIGQTSAYNEDPVVLLGAQGEGRIRVEEVAQWLGTIPYEVLTMLNTRVPRVYRGGAS